MRLALAALDGLLKCAYLRTGNTGEGKPACDVVPVDSDAKSFQVGIRGLLGLVQPARCKVGLSQLQCKGLDTTPSSLTSFGRAGRFLPVRGGQELQRGGYLFDHPGSEPDNVIKEQGKPARLSAQIALKFGRQGDGSGSRSQGLCGPLLVKGLPVLRD